MALDDHLHEERPQTKLQDVENIRPRLRSLAQEDRDLKTPVITPDDTRALIEHLYEKDVPMPSAVEKAYAKRLGHDLEQFGYDIFSGANPGKKQEASKEHEAAAFAIPSGGVQDDFLLNMGDRVNVTFRGQRNDNKSYVVNTQGQLIVDDMRPLPAAGLTMRQLREELEAEASLLYNTQVFVALESVRQVNVLVVGHVRNPGRRTLTVFHTVLDALMSSGGIEKAGSLRQVKLVRDGRSTIIDLYSLLIHGSPIMDMGLRDGDRIIVQPIGPTIAIAGAVKRPSIYEILPGPWDRTGQRDPSQTLSLDEALSLAGGILSPGHNRFMALGLTPDGREAVEEIADPERRAFSDGAILLVEEADEMRTGTVALEGHTRRAGVHALSRAPTLSALLENEKVFGRDIYPLIGVIKRRNEKQMTRELIAFPPLQVIQGKFDQSLQDGDTVLLFSRKQIMKLQEKEKLLQPAAYKGETLGKDKADDIADDPVLASFLRERAAFVRGAVRAEGAWPVTQGTTLENLLAVSGGLTLEASTSDIEITSKLLGDAQQEGRSQSHRATVDYSKIAPAEVWVGPGDSVHVKQKFQKVAENSVLIIGEVLNPGRYDLAAGDRLSHLIARAGGLTPEAYPDGAIFSRESERRAEEARFRAQAQQLESGLAAALQKDDEPDAAQVNAVQELAGQLRNAEAVGRITVEAEPEVLALQPELDILLETKDRIYIPKRPLTVRIAGEVLSPASLQFRKDKDPRDYIMEAGGFTYNADKDRAFVIYPDGSAQPLQVGSWSHSAVFVPPGSTIVVPRDPKPFDFLETARDVSQILSNLAITGLFIEDMRDEE